eukprot:56029-Prymnesium_polylepis.2
MLLPTAYWMKCDVDCSGTWFQVVRWCMFAAQLWVEAMTRTATTAVSWPPFAALPPTRISMQ